MSETDRPPESEARSDEPGPPAPAEPEEPVAARMPPEGNYATVALWLLATVFCGYWFLSAALFAFDAASGIVPAERLVRNAIYGSGFGVLTIVHVVLAVRLRWGRRSARTGAMTLAVAGFAWCAYLAAGPIVHGPDLPFLGVGHGMLGLVVYASVFVAAGGEAVRDWCEQDGERPDPAGPGRS